MKILAAMAVTAMLAIGANGQGASGASAGGTAGSGTAAGGGTSTGTSSGVNGVNTVPNNPTIINSGIVTPNPNQGAVILAPPINPNTPVVGNSMGPNNLGIGSNNLALGTNTLGIGSNQFSLRTNGLRPTPLTPTGPNGSGFLSNNTPINPLPSTNRILLNP